MKRMRKKVASSKPVDLQSVAIPNKNVAGMMCLDLTVLLILSGSTLENIT
jgi:hypothetical protein